GQLLVARLIKLGNFAKREGVVVFLSAFAGEGGGKEIAVFPADADPNDAQTWLPLIDVLRVLSNCSAEHKLLILDIMRPLADPSLGVLANDVAARVQGALDDVPDPLRLLLCACSPG